MRNLLLIGLGILAPFCGARAELLVSTNSVWRYHKGNTEASSPASAWRALAFDASSWSSGATPIYYGENLAGGTVLSDMRNNYTSVYLRQNFDVADVAAAGRLQLTAFYDDGFIAWINGREVARVNVGAGEIAATGTAGAAIEPTWVTLNLPVPEEYLRTGNNVLAVHLLNANRTSSDIVFNAQLAAFAPDLIPPVITAVDPAPGQLTLLTEVRVTFSEPVIGVTPDDFLVNNRSAAGVTGSGAVYTFAFPQPPYGTVDILWESGHGISDLAFPPNPFDETSAAARWSYTLADQTPPAVATANPAANTTVRKLTQVEVLFTEPVFGVEASDLLLNGSAAEAVTGEFSGPYLFSFAEPAPGTARFEWAAGHGITDRAEPANPFGGGAWNLQFDPNAPLPSVRINEFMASARATPGYPDEEGELEDWIEIYNAGATLVNLGGWSLTDDPDEPGQWTFPSVELAPGAYLVVFASAKDRRGTGPGTRLHTNFKLSATGEYLALFNAESPRAALTEFAPRFPEQRGDYSYGLDSSDAWRYFQASTPGRVNGSTTIQGLVPEPHLSVQRGFFKEPFRLVISSPDPEVRLRYTLDGSEPASTTGQLYSGPISISETTVIRAMGFKTDTLPSLPATATFIFPAQVLRQPNNPAGYAAGPGAWAGYPSDFEMDPEIVDHPDYRDQMEEALLALPTLSIVMKPDDMFGAASGIYTHPTSRGPSWERPCSLELILPDGGGGFQVNAGVQIQGNAARDPQKQPKHPMRVVFKGDYGPATLGYRIFPDSPVEVFDTLVLRADFNFSWLHWNPAQRLQGQRTRDSWTKDTMRAMGGLASHNRYVHLYINGLYWGIYDPSERPDGSFGAAYLGGEKEDYDVVNEGAVVDGSRTAYDNMLRIDNLQSAAQYQLMQQSLDMPQFIDYMLLHFYMGHSDWGNNKNWYTLRNKNGGAFKYVPWDGEMILDNPSANRVSNSDVPSGLHTKLLASSEYRLDFADRVRRHLFNDGPLTPAPAAARWMKRSAEVELPIIAESARWGDYRRDVHQYQSGPYFLYTRNQHWVAERNRLLTQYFPARTGNLLNQLKSAGLYPAVEAPSFNQHGGPISPSFRLQIAAPSGTVYYTTDGSDPRVRFTGTVSPQALPYSVPVPLNGTTTRVKARALAGGTWSALNEALFESRVPTLPIRISEIMYNPPDGDTYEFIELHYTGSTALDLSGWSFGGFSFVFPAGSVLNGPGYALLAANLNPAAFAQRYPGVPVFGYFSGNLSNGGETVTLRDADGRTVTFVDYDDAAPWPIEADGAGYSIEFAGGNPNAAESWRRSHLPGGTPARAPDGPAESPGVRINEVVAVNSSFTSPDGRALDWIELLNSGTEPVSLEGWSLSDDSDPKKYVFPSGAVIGSNAHLVVWCNATLDAPGFVTGFALDRDGDQIFLFDPAGNRVSGVSFGPQIENFSLGLIDGQWTLTHPTPGAVNDTEPVVAPVSSLVINEWLANSLPGAEDWIELFNRDSARPVALKDLFLTTHQDAFQIQSHLFVPPGGHLLLWADADDGPDRLGFKLPATGTVLSLLDPSGSLIDQITLGPQSEGVSEGRLPDGAATISSFPQTPSPGAENHVVTYAGPRLNELSARHAGAWTNAAGWGSDWIELFNPDGAPFSMDGMSLSLDSVQPGQWAFPSGTTVPPNGFLLVHCDRLRPASLENEPVLNAGRSLDGNSGGAYLFNPFGHLVDSIEYGAQILDRSIGISGGTWQLQTAPTPGEPNLGPATLGSVDALRVNEWMASLPEGGDWFEVYNGNPLPVALQGLVLTDSPSISGSVQFRIHPLTFVDGHGHVVFVADDKTSAGRNHVNFSLNAAGESLRIYSASGQLIDSVEFGLQSPGVSQGRLPDGSAQFEFFPDSATPGAANGVLTDTDDDGLPDTWESTHGLDPREPGDAALDLDGDGFNNLAEYIAGTDPADPASFLAVQILPADPGTVTVRFAVKANRDYTLQMRTSAVEGDWIKVLDLLRRPEDSTREFTISAPAGARYYRLVCTLPPQ